MPHGHNLYKMQEGGGTEDNPRPRLRLGPVSLGGHRRTAASAAPAIGAVLGLPYGVGGDDELQSILNAYALAIGEGGGLGSSSSSSLAVPPVLELLGEMRMRREAEAQQAVSLAEIIGSNVPRGQEFYPGYEPGSVADVLLGIITGGGPARAQEVLPANQRRVRRTGIPVPQGQPDVSEEFGAASSMAQQILDAIRVIQTGSSGPATSG